MKIPMNLVLVKPDKDYTEITTESGFTLELGKDDGKTATSAWEARHWSVTGTIIQLPETLFFYGDEMKKLKDENGGNIPKERLNEFQTLRNASLDECPIIPELQLGDRVWFHYMIHMEATQTGLTYNHPEHGECFFMKYDSIFAVNRNNETFPVNGWIWIKPETYKQEEVDGLIFRHDLQDKEKPNLATIVKVSSPIKYLHDHYYDDPTIELKEGDKIIYNSSLKLPLEYSLHQTKELRGLEKIRRHHIYLIDMN